MGLRKLPNGRYRIDWRDEYGVRHRAALGFNKQAALGALAKKITARAERRSLDIKKDSPLTFRELAALYLERHAKTHKVSWRTDELKIRRFNETFGSLRIGRIAKDHIDGYTTARLNNSEKKVCGGTVNKEVAILKKIFQMAVDLDKLEKNPCARYPKFRENPPKDRYLELGEFQSLCEALERLLTQSNKGKGWRAFHLKQFRTILPMGFDTGGRREEIILLTDDDINFEARLIRYKYRKGGEEKVRFVPMTERVYQLLRTMPRDKKSAYLFPDETGGAWKAKKSFYRAFDMIANESKLKNVTFHTLRHSFNTHLALNGVDSDTRQKLMGHTNPKTQERYTHISDQHTVKAIKILDTLGLRAKTVDTFWTLDDFKANYSAMSDFKSAYNYNTN